MFPEINKILTLEPKKKPEDEGQLGFGTLFTDHMFVMDYVEGHGWINPCIQPYAPLTMDPSTVVLHYGQAVFEGMKAYRRSDGGINLFRPQLNFERMNRSAARMGIPPVDEDFMLHALCELLEIDQDWVPGMPGTSLYIRPFIFATDEKLGVSISKKYKLMIIMSPSGVYYKSGLSPVPIYIEDQYVRAVRGGTGEAKCAGNYAASLVAQGKAEELGYEQVLWLDGVEQRYVEEVGSMNVFFVIDDKVVTPELSGGILPGITRRSVIELCRHWNLTVEERKLSVEELLKAAEDGRVTEAFGSGTAAVISPIGSIYYEGKQYIFNDGEIGSVSHRIYDAITGIQYGTKADELSWIQQVN